MFFVGVRDDAATRGLYLALSKDWLSCFVFGYVIRGNCTLLSFDRGPLTTEPPRMFTHITVVYALVCDYL